MGKLYKFLGKLLAEDFVTFGPDNIVDNDDCVVAGSNLQTGGDHQTIFGKYNQVLSGDYCFIIGHGAYNRRKNILALSDNGDLTVSGTIAPEGGYENLPRYVKDVVFVDTDYTVYYSDGTSKTGKIKVSNLLTATGNVTAVYTNAETIYYIKLDSKLSTDYIYNIDNNASSYFYPDNPYDGETETGGETTDNTMSAVTQNLSEHYSFCITDVDGVMTTITVGNGSGSGYPPTPGEDFKFTYNGKYISWSYIN